MMKIFTKVFAIVLALMMLASLAACGGSDSKDDEKKAETAAATEAADVSALVGTWESQEAPGTLFIFKEDGTGSISASGTSIGFTYEDEGSKVVLTNGNDAEQKETYKYTIEGDILTMESEELGGVLTYKRSGVSSTENGGSGSGTADNGSALVGSWKTAEGIAMTFNADGSGVMQLGTETMTFTYEDKGSTFELIFNDTDPQTATYTLDGETLSITDESGITQVFTKQ